ncbi:MAG TPA: phosphoribosyltransferase family protein [Burkholderiaceae bacterium]|nr:phosphoribosyltransferase family protein [Burkholderiaceae bacterium]
MFERVSFADRNDAGRRLAVAVGKIPLERPVVYALPRGGVPVAIQVATALDAPLDLVLVRKIGAPGQPELAVGAIVDGDRPETLVNEDIAASTGADAVYLASVQERERHELERRRAAYLAGRAPVDPVHRDAIVVDDGVATGASMLVAVRALRHRGARRVIVATPVAPPETVARLEREADLVVCLTQPDWFPGISAFYDDFHQLEDREVVELLRAAAAPDSTA